MDVPTCIFRIEFDNDFTSGRHGDFVNSKNVVGIFFALIDFVFGFFAVRDNRHGSFRGAVGVGL